MDHHWIDEQGVAEAYVLGRLAPAEETSFEEHLLTCGDCRERVTWAEELHGSLRAMAAQERVRGGQLGLLAGLAWFARRGHAARLGLAAGVVLALAAALVSGLLFEEARLRRRAPTAAARLPAPPAVAASRPAASGQPEWTAERVRLEAQLRRQEEQLRRERRRGDGLSDRLAELSRPQVNTVIASLGLVRGQGDANRLLLGPRPAWVVLSIELPAPGPGDWHAALVDGRGRTIWSGGGLRAALNDTLALSFPSTLLAPGAYRLVLDRPGEPSQHGEIPFEVVTRR
jgi:Putative zinc-finger